jgi:hypothetical protein
VKTKQEIVNYAVANWADSGLPNPEADKYAFIRALVADGSLPADQPLPSGARMVREALAGVTEPVPDAPEGGVVSRSVRKQRYRLEALPNGDRRYVFFPRNQEPFAIAEQFVQDMKRAYAHKPDGLGWTINRCCTHWRIGRREFEFMRAELGWTHDQDEFTREEHLELETEQLLEDREQRSRWRLEQTAKKQELDELRRLASLGQDLEARDEALRVAMMNYSPPARKEPRRVGAEERLLVVPFSDLHLGAPGTGDVLEHLCEFIRSLPSGTQVLPVWNGDLFHVDTPSFTTTRGTVQERGAGNDPYKTLELVYGAAFQATDMLAQKAGELLPAVVVAGNHDEMACYHLKLVLKAAGYDVGYGVDDQEGEALKYFVWHDELLLFEHGDGGHGRDKARQFVLAAMQRHRQQFATTKRTTVFTGHLHHAKWVDLAGVMHFQLPSPEAHSRWARKNGYEGQRGFQAFEYDKTGGLVKTHWRLFDAH